MLKLTSIVTAGIYDSFYLYLFISLKEVLRRFCKVVFLLIKTKKLCLDSIIQSRNNRSNYYSFWKHLFVQIFLVFCSFFKR